ncbi:hypothetical protein, partial [Enterobacter cloacae]
ARGLRPGTACGLPDRKNWPVLSVREDNTRPGKAKPPPGKFSERTKAKSLLQKQAFQIWLL